MVKRSLSCAGLRAADSIIWACIVLLMGSRSLWAGESTSPSAAVTHKVYACKSISAEAAKAYLSRLGLGTVSQLPGTNGLLITGDASDLSKAQTVLKLVDVDRVYEIRLAGPESLLANLPGRDRIAAAIGDIAVGSLDTLPSEEGKAPVVIDRHRGQVLLIAPKEKMDRIVCLVEGKDVTPSLGQDVLSAELGKSAKTSLAEVASWTKSHVLGAAQEEPNATAADANTPVPSVPAAASEGRITGPAVSGASGPNPSGAKVQSVAEGTVPGKPRSLVAGPAGGAEAANPAYPTPAVPTGEQTLKLDLQEKFTVESLLGLVGSYLNLNFMYDPAAVQGDVTLKLQGDLRGPVKVNDLYPLLESVLRFKGLAMTRRGNIVTVVKATDVMDADPKLRTRGGPVEFGDAVITRVFRLRHVDTSSVEGLMTQMKLGVAFSSIPDTRTLIVTGFTATMPKVETLLDLVDQPGEPKQFRYRQLKYTMATTLAEKVKALAEQLGTIQVSVSAGVGQQPMQKLPNESEAAFTARRSRDAVLRQQATRAPTSLSSAVSPESVYLDADERTNRVLMIGRQEQLGIVEKLVDSLDVQQQDLRSLVLYRIEHVDALDVRKKLEELSIVAPTTQTTYQTPSRITGTQRPQTQTPGAQSTPQSMVQTTESQTGAGTPLDAPQVIVVEATNALLVNATAEQHKRISEILKYVDSETLDSAMPFDIYPLENQSPGRMAEVLDKLIQEKIKDKDNKIEQVVKKIEDEITIVPDPNTYSLVVHASPKNQQWIGKLVKTLDKRRPQVLIDVTLVEVSKTDAFNYDLNLISSIPDLSKATGLVGTAGVISGTLQKGNVMQAASGKLTGFYGDEHINALLSTMQNKKYGRVLAKPKVLVNDNEKGTIKTTDTTYVLTKTGTLPTQGSQVVQTSETYQPYDAGITMEITPHISEGDLLQLNVNLSRSDFTTTPSGSQPPDKSQSDITTVVTVPDKSTIILGGMIKLNQSKSGTKVPILGDLPLVGTLFRNVGNSDVERKLYVFVKAEVIRPADVMAGSDAMQKLSDRHRTAFEKHEAEFQQEQTIPGIQGKPMSPEKVLDAQ